VAGGEESLLASETLAPADEASTPPDQPPAGQVLRESSPGAGLRAATAGAAMPGREDTLRVVEEPPAGTSGGDDALATSAHGPSSSAGSSSSDVETAEGDETSATTAVEARRRRDAEDGEEDGAIKMPKAWPSLSVDLPSLNNPDLEQSAKSAEVH